MGRKTHPTRPPHLLIRKRIISTTLCEQQSMRGNDTKEGVRRREINDMYTHAAFCINYLLPRARLGRHD